MGIWVGGGFALLIIWPPPARRRSVLIARFSRAALASLVILALSGSAMAVQHLGAPADLFVTPYGRTLSVKRALFLAALLLALAGFRVSPEDRRRWWTRDRPYADLLSAPGGRSCDEDHNPRCDVNHRASPLGRLLYR